MILNWKKLYFWKENKGYELLIGRENGKKSLVKWDIFKKTTTIFFL